MSRPIAVLDANVLYGIVPTDLLITLAIEGVYRPHWTDAICDEAIRNIGDRHVLATAVTVGAEAS
ncbi:hypothetical protein [Ilumatobacter sp.]|uniref:hypothetical protein n=1 Tax=Ilumatobacter sp. TaxID=1967498 RepID=UPI003753D7FC